jgi:hypothetical protein
LGPNRYKFCPSIKKLLLGVHPPGNTNGPNAALDRMSHITHGVSDQSDLIAAWSRGLVIFTIGRRTVPVNEIGAIR